MESPRLSPEPFSQSGTDEYNSGQSPRGVVSTSSEAQGSTLSMSEQEASATDSSELSSHSDPGSGTEHSDPDNVGNYSPTYDK